MMVLAGCAGVQYTGTEEQMQQVARGAAELMKKDPYSGVVSAAGTGAHMALSMLAKPAEEAEPACVQTFRGCLPAWQANAAPAEYGQGNSMEEFTGLPKDFYKTTSIGKD
ncbi:hypothetical protein [Cupriavidus taiwanensis]|uniref:hypothetical protein n=1 Tax=Cupriavidus taiwanensis TaxID=164546 RepID=UPI0011C03B99|nr:hypothetical protein [Cupriavidus taiwanensis]